MFISLTDVNVYGRMLDISLNSQKKSIEIIIPTFLNTKQQEIFQFILEENYQKETENTPDTQKYRTRKEKMDAAFKNYVNMERNRIGCSSLCISIKGKGLHNILFPVCCSAHDG